MHETRHFLSDTNSSYLSRMHLDIAYGSPYDLYRFERGSSAPQSWHRMGALLYLTGTGGTMANENELETTDVADVNTDVAPTPEPYVRKRPAHRTVEPIDDLAEDREESAPIAHDSDYTVRGSALSGRAYRRSRAEGQQLRRDLHYGQYLEIPKGRRDIFVSRERKTRVKTFFALVAVLALLAAAAYFLWEYMQTNWGATG